MYSLKHLSVGSLIALIFVSSAAFGQLLAPASYSPIAVTSPTSVTTGDVLGNGTTQMVVAGANTVTVITCNSSSCTKQPAITVGTTPIGVAIGDYNGDGKPDIAVANSGSGNVTILLNNGDTTYSQAANSPVAAGSGPTGIVTGDFNGDGKLDLAVSNVLSNNVTILLGNGDGTFHSNGNILVGTFPASLAVADFNADGKLDLAVANQTDSTATILLGNGNGGFSAATGSPISLGLTPLSVAVGDLNGDGIQDLAFTGGSGSATVFLGRGDGSFAVDASGPFPVGASPTHIAIGDVNNDSFPDLIVSGSGGSGTISVLLGNGSGAFFAALNSPFVPSSTRPYNWVAVGDVNGDGKLDVEAVSTDGNLTILANVGSLTTTPEFITFNTSAGQGPTPPINVQVTKSGASVSYSATVTQSWMTAVQGTGVTPDTLAVSVNPSGKIAGTYKGKVILRGTQNGDGNVQVTMNVVNGSGSLNPLAGSPFTAGAQPHSLAAADFNGDGKPDLAIANFIDGSVTLLLSNGAGGFTPGSAIATASPFWVVAGDFNGDGKADLAVASYGNGTVTILLGTGNGNFTASPGGPYSVGANPTQIVVGDFNADGKLDLAVVSSAGVRVLINIGDGGFDKGPALPCTCSGPLAVGDFNGDGLMDLAALDSSGGIDILAGTGSSAGVLAARGLISTIRNPTALAVGDFNSDGKLDIAALNSDGTISLAFGDGQFGFGAPVAVSGVSVPGALIPGDFNGDGILDLAVTNASNSGGLTVLLGNGSGAFTPKIFATGADPVAAVTADFNLDGTPDLAVANFLDNNVTVLLAGLANISVVLTAPSSVPAGQTVNLSAQVSTTGTVFATPTGTVSFKDGNTTLQTVNLVNGTAAYSTTLSAGVHPITAVYNGDAHTKTATSNAVNVASIGPPSLSITKTHTGSFQRGQQGATYTVTVSNAISGQPTVGTVTVTDTVPSGENLVSMSGSGWSCTTPPGSCSRSDSVNTGASYPPITVTVNVLFGATSPQSNSVSVSGGGSPTANAIDSTTIINPIPVGLGFFPILPCRAVDTRPSQNKPAPFGPPALASFVPRDFPLTSAGCLISPSAQAYSLNFTLVPAGPVDFLSTWASGLPYPGVSTLNSPDASVIANAAIVPAGNNGAITVLSGKLTDLVIDANGYFAPPTGSELVFYPIAPCRIVDTRADQGKTGAFGPPNLSGFLGRDFPIAGNCGIPASAQAFSLNFTAVPLGGLGFLSTWPSGQPYTNVSTLNSSDGSVIANAAIVPAGTNGSISVLASNPTNVIIDANGYFAAPGGMGALHFYPITPCRAADTRQGQGKSGGFGPPSLAAFTARDFNIPGSGCGVPANAQAFALNLTAVPQGHLDFLSAWPSGQPYPNVSTLNSPKGTVLANMAIVPAGTNGAITVLAGNPTDLIIDISGYFAP